MGISRSRTTCPGSALTIAEKLDRIVISRDLFIFLQKIMYFTNYSAFEYAGGAIGNSFGDLLG